MGIETIVATMPKKKLDLFKNLVSVGVILTIAYGVFSMIGLDSPLQFFNTSAFMTCAMLLIGLSFAWKILNGAKIVVPSQPNQQQNQFNKSYQQPKKTSYSGSWQCPTCGKFVIGDQCEDCNRRR